VLDSGLGGLVITNELKDEFPNQDFIFIADSANFPYGTKIDTDLEAIISNMICFLEQLDVDFIVVACNTASSVIERCGLVAKVPLITIINMTVEHALAKHKGDGFLVLGTSATVKSKIYASKLKSKGVKPGTVLELDCQPLVSFVETAQYRKHGLSRLEDYFADIERDANSTIILGCTHFILLEESLPRIFPNSSIVSPVNPLKLEIQSISTKDDPHPGKMEIYTTGDPVVFAKKAGALVDGHAITRVCL